MIANNEEEINDPQNQTKDQIENKSDSESQKSTENTEIKALESRISELEQKNSDLNDKLLRSLAEIENIRKRSREEVEKANKFALSNFASELVPIVENFFMASENAPREEIEKNQLIKNYAQAIIMTEKELIKLLEKNQIKRIFPLNQDFDHNYHEAITQVESDAKEGLVVQVIQAGYSISERLIRPALVGVAKPKSS